MEDVGIVSRVSNILERLKHLVILVGPRQHSRMHTRVDSEVIDPLFHRGIAHLHKRHTITCMRLEQIAHTLTAQIGSGKHDTASGHLHCTHPTLQHHRQQCILHRARSLADFIQQHNHGLVAITNQQHVGQKAHHTLHLIDVGNLNVTHVPLGAINHRIVVAVTVLAAERFDHRRFATSHWSFNDVGLLDTASHHQLGDLVHVQAQVESVGLNSHGSS